MKAWWRGLVLAPLLALSACFLSSSVPIIDRTDVAPGFDAGRYETLEGQKPGDLAKVPAGIRAGCVDPGYVATERDEHFKPTGAHSRIVYCAYDADKGEGKPISDISVAGADYQWQAGEDKSTFRLKAIRDDFYLMQVVAQVSGGAKLDAPLYVYLVIRARPDRIEAYVPDCAQFPGIQTKKTDPVECGVTSFGALAPDLPAYLAAIDKGDEVPIAMLRQVR